MIAHQVADRVTAPPMSAKPVPKKSASKAGQKKKAAAEPVLAAFACSASCSRKT